jgi:hypothetical protein
MIPFRFPHEFVIEHKGHLVSYPSVESFNEKCCFSKCIYSDLPHLAILKHEIRAYKGEMISYTRYEKILPYEIQKFKIHLTSILCLLVPIRRIQIQVNS